MQCQYHDNPQSILVTPKLMQEFMLSSLDPLHPDVPKDASISLLELLKKVIHRWAGWLGPAIADIT